MFPILLSSKAVEAEQPVIGKIFSWGENGSGQLGNNGTADVSSPIQTGSATNWVALSHASHSTVAVDDDGKLWSWGLGATGRLGSGSTSSRSVPVQVGSLTDWKSGLTNSISGGGGDHTLIIKSDGKLWAWGDNGVYVLGDTTQTVRSSPILIASSLSWRKVASASNHSLGITTDGKLYSWGSPGSGKLGGGNASYRNAPTQVGALTTWIDIALTTQASFGITSAGTAGKLWSWGGGGNGQTGHGNTTSYCSPVQIGCNTNWTSVSAGTYCVGAINSNNDLFTWGSGGSGRLGLGNTTTYSSPVQVASPSVDWATLIFSQYTGMAQTTSGHIYTWGQNATGKLGTLATADTSVPAQIGSEKWRSTAFTTSGSSGSHMASIKS